MSGKENHVETPDTKNMNSTTAPAANGETLADLAPSQQTNENAPASAVSTTKFNVLNKTNEAAEVHVNADALGVDRANPPVEQQEAATRSTTTKACEEFDPVNTDVIRNLVKAEQEDALEETKEVFAASLAAEVEDSSTTQLAERKIRREAYLAQFEAQRDVDLAELDAQGAQYLAQRDDLRNQYLNNLKGQRRGYLDEFEAQRDACLAEIDVLDCADVEAQRDAEAKAWQKADDAMAKADYNAHYELRSELSDVLGTMECELVHEMRAMAISTKKRQQFQ